MTDSLAIIGSGNTAWQLGHQFVRAQLPLQRIITRNKEDGEALANELGIGWQALGDSIKQTGVFICVADQAIHPVSQQLKGSFQWLLHCSGSIPLQAISTDTQKGVFYPLQTMSKGRVLDGSQLPICLEANDDQLLDQLKEMAKALGSPSIVMNSETRKNAHLSAVMVNNFVNHLLHRSQDFATGHGVDASIMQPLIRETIEKFVALGGRNAQTGPAKRGDLPVILEQQELLLDQPALLKLYQLFTESIEHEFSRT